MALDKINLGVGTIDDLRLGGQVDHVYLGPTKVFGTRFELSIVPLAVSPDLGSAVYITLQPESFQVDWGDGNWIDYPPGTATSDALGTVKVRSDNLITSVLFSKVYRNYKQIHLDLADHLDFISFDGLTSLQIITIADPYITRNLTNGQSMFRNCNDLQVVPMMDTSSITRFDFCWEDCSSLISFPLLDFSGVTLPLSFDSTWSGCTSLTSFPLIDTSAATSLSNTWGNNSALTEFPLIDTSGVTTLFATFQACTTLTEFPLIDTSSVTQFYGTWRNSTGLSTFPLIDMSAGTDFRQTFLGCDGLTALPALDTSLGDNFSLTFSNCTNLVCLSSVNTLLQTNTLDMFTNTPSLVAPDSAEQTLIENGYNYINPGACPSTSPTIIQVSGVGAPITVASVTIDASTGWSTPTAGKLLVAFGAARSDWIFDTPVGWTALFIKEGSFDSGAVFYKISDGTESSVTFARSSTDNRYANVHMLEIDNASSIVQYVEGTDPPQTLPGTTPGSLVVGFGWSYLGVCTPWSPPMVENLYIHVADDSSTSDYVSTGGDIVGDYTFTGGTQTTILLEIE